MSIFGTPAVKFQDSFGGSSLTHTFNTAIGDLIVVGIIYFAGVASVSDSAGNSYTALTARNDSFTGRNMQWFFTVATNASASNVVTASSTIGAGVFIAAFWDFPITGGTPVVDTDTNINHDTASPVASPSFNISGSDELILAICGQSSNYGDFVQGSGYTMGPLQSDLSFHRGAAEYGLFSGPTSGVTAGFTYPDASTDTDTFAIAFKASGGGGGGSAKPVVCIMQ